MIDTIDIFCDFPSLDEYNLCYKSVDYFSRQLNKQALHSYRGKKNYITTAFADIGILQISFQKHKYQNACYIILKPARLFKLDSYMSLVTTKDFSEVCRRMDSFIEKINWQCEAHVLPSICKWRVRRIDYAVNIVTAYVNEYIKLFYAGNIPKSYSSLKLHQSSFYLKSKSGNINFYDKLQQLRDKHNFTDMEVNAELGNVSQGILRLEFQCTNKYIHHLKEHYHLADTTLPYLWNAKIAENELRSRVESIIGKTDFFSYDNCVRKLESLYERRTLSLCLQIIRILRDNPNANLRNMEKLVSTSARKQFHSFIHKIRKAGVNPIPLEAAGNCAVKELTNPYNLIRLS